MLTLLPLLFAPLYIPLLLGPSPLLAAAALASLALTASTTHLSAWPLFSRASPRSSSRSRPRPLSAKARGKLPARDSALDDSEGGRWLQRLQQLLGRAQDAAEQYGAWANVALCLLLVVATLVREREMETETQQDHGGGDGGEWIRLLAPLPVATVAWLGTWWVGEEVDVTELERLRYRLKGV